MRMGRFFIKFALENRLKIEYAGCHSPDRLAPLYGRAAYWRLYTLDGRFLNKITASVKSLNPRQDTLIKLLVIELNRRISQYDTVIETDDFGSFEKRIIDPYDMQHLINYLLNDKNNNL